MTIKQFFDNIVTVRRLKTVSGNKVSMQSTATADCEIQSLSREARKAQGILEERAWVAYFSSDTDFIPKIGDHITDSEGKTYKIIDVTDKDYSYGINQHIEVVMIEYNA